MGETLKSKYDIGNWLDITFTVTHNIPSNKKPKKPVEIKTIMPIKSDSEYTFKSTTENVDLDRIIRESKGQDFILVKIEEKDANAKVRYEFFVSKKILDHPAINFDSLHKSPLLGGHIAGFYARRDWGRSMEDYNAPKSEFNNSYRRASKSFSNTTPNV